jgi:hypothetical protein
MDLLIPDYSKYGDLKTWRMILRKLLYLRKWRSKDLAHDSPKTPLFEKMAI